MNSAEFISQFEGCAKKKSALLYEAYPDPDKGWAVPTIGYGTTHYPSGKQVHRGDVCSKEQALVYLNVFVEKEILPQLCKIPTWYKMNRNQQLALIDFAYNLGQHFYGNKNFKSITALCADSSCWTNKDFVIKTFSKYCSPGSDVEEGLLKRRKAEATLFLTSVEN